MQCQALTLKGQQCKNQVSKEIKISSDGHSSLFSSRKPSPSNQVCLVHFNVFNNGNGTMLKFASSIVMSVKDKSSSPGNVAASRLSLNLMERSSLPPSSSGVRSIESHIYIYTFRNSVESANAHVYDHKSNRFMALPKGKQLIKVGYTSRDVNKRLSEWEFKCGHKLVLLNSYNLKESYTSTLETRRRGLFIESLIHDSLKRTYGSGHVVCEGCDSSMVTVVEGKNSFRSLYNVNNPARKHVEWFLINKVQIKSVYNLIDKIIHENNDNPTPYPMTETKIKPKKRWLCF
ncbi:hypothetical protein NADFUDRAFT_51181 [Nadsonia fulvescens var. elongata DSM 6958]|uniref:DUF1766-domain-containing protein n=1 Tax=Nadsonia fulvescens var. elongata DSM 6958 TaxID=857566 RepID=A0A1E3PKE6_9ASCO|nr:hypothetical protein NADFUDRAFT_51181 [Nadsonia fulvescens var. elongata DSM 6958]